MLPRTVGMSLLLLTIYIMKVVAEKPYTHTVKRFNRRLVALFGGIWYTVTKEIQKE